MLLQYPLDYYPPFASGCGFIMSRDLVQALLKQPLPDYRLLVGVQGVFTLHPAAMMGTPLTQHSSNTTVSTALCCWQLPVTELFGSVSLALT